MMASVPHEAASLEVLLSALPSLPRPLLARLTTRLIERLDDIDGDPDFQQADGDELDFNAAEDDFCDHSGWKAEAGCPVADPGEEDDPGGGNVEDEGENAGAEDAGGCGEHGIDQRELRWNGGGGRFD